MVEHNGSSSVTHVEWIRLTATLRELAADTAAAGTIDCGVVCEPYDGAIGMVAALALFCVTEAWMQFLVLAGATFVRLGVRENGGMIELTFGNDCPPEFEEQQSNVLASLERIGEAAGGHVTHSQRISGGMTLIFQVRSGTPENAIGNKAA